jgi:hypothetical protein
MDIVQLVPGIGDLASLADALALLEHPGSAATRSLSLSGPISFSDFEGDCCVVYRPYRPWEDLVPIPGNGRPAPDQFVVRLRGQIVVPELEDDERADAASHNPGSVDNVWTLAVASDDGFRLKVVTSAGRTHEERPGRRARTEWTAENTQPRGIAVGPLLSIRFPKRGGTFPFELVYFERAGGAILHLAAAPGSRDTFDANSFAVVEATRQILPQGGDGHGER